jgi:hypothetical protein
MDLRWRSGLAVAVLLAAPPLAAQQVRELGVQLTATASDPALAAAGVYAALRPSLRTRLSAAAAAGLSDDQAAWRGELLIHFLLSPTKRAGLGAYAAGGVAMVAGPVDRGYIVASIGVEARPGGSPGWFLEAGVGGGARVAAGLRWRWFPPGWILQQ